MKTSTVLFATFGLITTWFGDAVPWEHLNVNDSLLLILDLQVGLYQLARDWDPTLCSNNMLAHAGIGKLFDLPVFMSTSAQQGPNGPLPKEILDMDPDAPLVTRQGEVDAWDNAEFRATVKAANKSQIIVSALRRTSCRSEDILSM
ncbi:hypothetical protein B0A55_11001 [Friedmanniomyces simplex]|uniref:Isochorismatase-like domain-containing protein n=1 Tax=Friedmanniomyces simplex TaxID=329884 RepID=A0A4U0WFA5_9PEZI|nr:hypothetical protein B0A55_10824 [Friedmanniomyces simplex]TKA61248.1 hypothetical protein B0A55_11001 [Friedmanniomyces simplex]